LVAHLFGRSSFLGSFVSGPTGLDDFFFCPPFFGLCNHRLGRCCYECLRAFAPSILFLNFLFWRQTCSYCRIAGRTAVKLPPPFELTGERFFPDFSCFFHGQLPRFESDWAAPTFALHFISTKKFGAEGVLNVFSLFFSSSSQRNFDKFPQAVVAVVAQELTSSQNFLTPRRRPPLPVLASPAL